jgi:hypothetical protein
MMTEREAENKFCPFSANRVLEIATPQGKQIHTVYDPMSVKNHFCIGSRCMAWRWVEEVFVLNPGASSPERRSLRPSKTDGYCGLAGKPHD